MPPVNPDDLVSATTRRALALGRLCRLAGRHTRSGPRILASLRNLAIGALRLAGRHDITEATRWANRYMNRPFTILDLTP